MNPTKLKPAVAALLATLLVALASPAFADWGALNMPVGVTDTSRDVYSLHMIIFGICVAIGVVVFGAMFYSIVRHRKSRGVVPAQFHHSTAAEIAWTVVPLLILIGMAIPATAVLIDMEDTSGSELTIKVTGYQWKWGYEYIGKDVQFYSNLAQDSDRARQMQSGIDPASVENYLLAVDRRLVLPTNTKIRFLITSADVIHSWWVPDLGWKKDAIPGYINKTWTNINQPGVYRGQCTELCGRDHGFMPVVVEAKTPQEFEKWLAEQTADSGETEKTAKASSRGETVAAR